jgi:hypothetical protein
MSRFVHAMALLLLPAGFAAGQTGGPQEIVPLASGTTYSVGPDRVYKTPCAVSELVADGDTVLVDAGDYRNDSCVWRAAVTLRSAGGLANLIWTQGTSVRMAFGQAFWVIGNTTGPVVIDGFSFTGARVVDGNGAGIRPIGTKDVTIRNCVFTDNENGVLSNPGNYTITIENSVFSNNGNGGGAHQIYIAAVDEFFLRGSQVLGGKPGESNLVKTRARKSTLEYNYIDSVNSDTSWELDFSNGGIVSVVGNVVRQGAAGSNYHVVEMGLEGAVPGSKLTMAYNTLISARDGVWVAAAVGATCEAWNNTLDGTSMQPGGCQFPVNQGNRTGVKLSSGPTAWLPQGDAVGGAYAGSPLVPVSQYTYPVGVRPRTSILDAGAMESGSGVTGPPPPAPAPANPAWSVASGALPPGVTISSDGLISGTPTEAGTFTFTVQVVMPNGVTGSRRYTVVVASADAAVILPETLPEGKAGTTYRTQLQVK